MVLPVDTESYAYLFCKNLNEDVKLKSDEYGRWDIDFDFDNDDWYIVNGFDSVFNACVIAILTRFDELGSMKLYKDFGCRVHELIKANKNQNTEYHIELFVTDVLEEMRRIESVNWVIVTDCTEFESYNYRINFNVTCVLDEEYYYDDVDNKAIIEESFLV